MADEITIRPAKPGDAAAVSALINALASYFLADPDDSEAAAPHRFQSEADLEAWCAEPRARWLLCFRQDDAARKRRISAPSAGA